MMSMEGEVVRAGSQSRAAERGQRPFEGLFGHARWRGGVQAHTGGEAGVCWESKYQARLFCVDHAAS